MTALPVVAGRYEATELLGRGGAASVYRAWDRDLERWVAVKVLPADVGDRATAERRSEARMLAAVNHPGLVTLFDAITDDDATYLVMELLGGGTLRAHLAAPGLDLAAVALQVARGLAHIHAVGIVHRDVKPANILLAATPPGAPIVAKLSDFGIAHLVETSPASATSIVGTARYLSPEQAAGRPAGPPSDVYSLGLTLLEATTGAVAFPGDPAESLAARLVRDPDVPGTLEYRWRSLLTAIVARDPASRPTADEVAERLAALALPAAAEQTVTAPIGLPRTVPIAAGVPARAEAAAPPTATTPTLLTGRTAATRPLPGPRSRRRARLAGVALGGAVLIGAGAIVPSIVAASAPTPTSTPAAVQSSSPARPSASASPRPSRSRTATPSHSSRTTTVNTADVQRTTTSSSGSAHTSSGKAGKPVTGGPKAPGQAKKAPSPPKPSAPKGPGAPGAGKAPGPGRP